MPDPRPAYGYTELTPELARRMGQLWAARQYAGNRTGHTLLVDALTLPTAPPGPSHAALERRTLAWLRSLHQRSTGE